MARATTKRKKPVSADDFEGDTPATTGAAPKRTARGFEAGKSGRRLRSIPTNRIAINSLIRQYGANVVARSRYLALNNPYAAAAKDAYVSAMVGCGIKPSSLLTNPKQKAEVAEVFGQWTDEADADGLTDFYGLQGIVASEMFEAGEVFVRFRPRLAIDNLSVPLQIQLLPAEMLDLSHNEMLSTGGRIECGIEFDAIGRRVAYHFFRYNPGELNQFNALNANSFLKARIPASEVLHLFRPIRAGQIRGIPHTIAGIVTLAMVDLYDDAELERKRIAALFGAFVTRPRGESDEANPFAGTTGDSGADGMADPSNFALEPGAVVDLQEGQDIKFSEPADVGANYESFQYRCLLRAACGFGVPYSDMTGDLKQTSYGSIRAGLVAFRRRIEAMQHHVMIFQFCRPIWSRWFQEAVRVGAFVTIKAADYVSDIRGTTKVKWIPPKWEWIDPLKDRQAEKLAVDSGFKARSDVIEAEGYDPEEVDARIKADQDRASGLGITFIRLPSEVLVAPSDDTLVDSPVAVGNNASDEYDFG